MSQKYLTPEEAIEMLPDDEYVHTFRQSGIDGIGVLMGADWNRSDVIDAINKYKPQLSGQTASSMGHGIVLEDDRGFVFIETNGVGIS